MFLPPPSRPLHILFTIIGFAWRSGSETHVRDLALGLLRRGHAVTIFSPTLGELADEVRSQGVVVVDQISNVRKLPDLIHANHVIPLAEALIAFPRTPTFWVCHDAVAWHDEPPLFPQIVHYAGVDEICAERIALAGIDAGRLRRFWNAVDLNRIPARTRPPAARPTHAVALGKATAVIEALSLACEQRGIALTAIGGADAPVSDAPERLLVGSDIVFATARAASEGLACGCAAVLVDARGFGGLVTSANYDELARNNFGLRCLNAPIEVRSIVDAIDRLDVNDAMAVTERHRRERNIDALLDHAESIYAEMLKCPVSDAELLPALAAYIRQFTPHAASVGGWPWQRERAHLQRELAQCQTRIGQLIARNEALNLELMSQKPPSAACALPDGQRTDDSAAAQLTPERAIT